MGRIISGSVQRGIGVDKVVLAALDATNPQGGAYAKYTGTIAGLVGAGDVAEVVLDGITYGYSFGGGDTAPIMAIKLATATLQGTYNEKYFTIGAVGLDAGDEVTLLVGTTPYTYVVQLADTQALVATGLIALAVADTDYDFSAPGGGLVTAKAKARGVSPDVSCSFTVDPGGNATVTTQVVVVGAAGQTAWIVSAVGADVECVYGTLGAATPVTNAMHNYGPGVGTFSAMTLTTPGITGWDSYAAPMGSMRSSTFTSILEVSGGVGMNIEYHGYFGATLGWQVIKADAAYLAGVYVDIIDAGSAQAVVPYCTAFAANTIVDCTIQG